MITTAPDPPTNLSVDVTSEKVAQVSWSPPALGNHTGYKLKVSDRLVCGSISKSTSSHDFLAFDSTLVFHSFDFKFLRC